MKIFEPLLLKFESPKWINDPELGLIDTVLEEHPELIRMLASDITAGQKDSGFGRQDKPSVEQIVRAAIYKEMKHLDYRALEYAQEDSRICGQFVKTDPGRPYSFQVMQEYISRISDENLEKFMIGLNKIAIEEGLEDVKELRQDSTVIETNIHYPTNNSLVYDCIKESERLLEHLREEINGLSYEEYKGKAKQLYFKINVEKSEEKRIKLFKKQLNLFVQSINQVSNIVKKESAYDRTIKAVVYLQGLEGHHPIMEKVYKMTARHEILKEKVPVEEKIFSIYERHTDIIVKGKREVQFGHKVQISGGRSNLILTCEIEKGNPRDSELYEGTIDEVKREYGKVPESSVADGGYASKANIELAKGEGIANIVFNKIVGNTGNVYTSKRKETLLKKWRARIEAVISNLKRGFAIGRCNWKGWKHYRQKVYWSVIGYNIRVMTAAVIAATL